MLRSLLPLLLACNPQADKAVDDTAAAPFVPDVATGGCGMPDYDWAPLEDMGALVEAELVDGYTLSATAISTLLEAYGAGQFAPVPYGSRVYQVRYVTQDRGQAVEATAFLAFPDVPEATKVPLLTWTHGTTGFTDACAPTALGLEGAAWPIVFSSLGYAIAAPDYLGMNGFGDPAGFLHPYLQPEPTAVATLDAMRALLRLAESEGELATPDPDRVVMWGPSEGGFAALWADRYAPHYAPEFNIVATAAPVAPTDVRGLAVRGATVFGPPTAAIAATMLVMNQWHGDVGDLSDVMVEPFASELAAALGEGCSTDIADGITAIDQILAPAYIEAAETGDWQAVSPFDCYAEQATLNASAVPMARATPTLLVTGETDDLVPSDVIVPDLGVLCAQGMNIEAHTCAGLGHVDSATTSLPYQLDWIKARLEGQAMTGACEFQAAEDCAAL